MSKFSALKLHDQTLTAIEFSWQSGTVCIQIKNIGCLQFTNVQNLSAPKISPWGKSSSINHAEQSADIFQIEMQSGDIIEVKGEFAGLIK